MPSIKQQPKGRLYEKVEVYLCFTQSKTHGKDRVKFKGTLQAYSQEDANTFAKQRYGKLAFAELNCTVNQEIYKAKGIQTI